MDNFINQVDIKKGLTAAQVSESKRLYGENKLTPPKRTSLLIMFLSKFKDPTIILLCFAAVVSIVIGIIKDGNFFEGIGIIIAIILATGVAFYSEYKSAKEFDILNEIKEERAKVIRDGQFHTIPVNELVVGDVVRVELGDKIPSDGRIASVRSLYIDQSLLTGESRTVEKEVYPSKEKSDSAFEVDHVYRGTVVSDGSAIYVTTAVGDKTELGKIATSLATQEQAQTPLQEKLEVLSKQIGIVGMTVGIIIFLSLIVQSVYMEKSLTFTWTPDNLNTIVHFFMIAVTIVVVAVPEGLPLMVTMSLAFNMRKMAKSNCLVKQIEASETIGAMTVVCSDKTGTLTQNQMTAVWFYFGGKIYSKENVDEIKNNHEFRSMLWNSAVNSTAELEFESNGKPKPVGNATEAALLGLLHELGMDYRQLREEADVIKQVPFSSSRKRMITLMKKDGKYICLEKGAPTILIKECSHIMINDVPQPIENYMESIEKAMKEASSKAYRVLAFSRREMNHLCNQKTECCDDTTADHVLTGLVAISDPLRPDVDKAVETCHNAGIDVKMVTGDDIDTATAIAKECKILKNDDDIVLSSWDFEKLSDEELLDKAPRIKVLARSAPLDKLRLVKALQERKQTVGVTGDGTNDAPALRQADVGISMGKAGTEVAMEASNIVLLDDNFKSIVNGILWGRTIHENIQRLILFQLTVNFVALTVAFLGPFIGLEEKLPLTVIQLLWVNIIMDTFAALALSAEPPRPETMNEKPRSRTEHIITPSMAFNISAVGLFQAVMLLALFRFNFLGGTTKVEHLTILFTTFVMFQVWNEFNCRAIKPGESPFRGLSGNKMFLIIVGIIVVLQIVMVNIGGAIFRTVPLDLITWLKITAFTAIIIPVGYVTRMMARIVTSKKSGE
ncbi:MAG: calcium-translocating P-type ATPase, PMCA-type [Firmicutes bacterium]|nr:calcium-translocating P-type ATPase, PMCA-type [Bacillota bacterium]